MLKFFSLIFFIFIISSTSFAQISEEKVGEVLGYYSMMEGVKANIHNTECGYLVKKDYSFINEIKATLSARHWRGFKEFLKSDLANKAAWKMERHVRNLIDKSKNNSSNLQEACEIAIGIFDRELGLAKKEWELLKSQYSRR